MLELVGLFVLGFVVDVGWVAYVHCAERNRAFSSALISAGLITGSILGLGESIHHGVAATVFVLGHSCGTYAAVRWKGRRTTTTGSSSSA